MTNGAINLAEKLSGFADIFAPRTVAEYNAHDIMVGEAEGAVHLAQA